VAKRARSKFTHLAPVWYQVRGDAGRLELTGGHDMDARWLQALRASPHEVASPRLLRPGRPCWLALPGCRPQTCELALGAGCAAVSAAALPRLMLAPACSTRRMDREALLGRGPVCAACCTCYTRTDSACLHKQAWPRQPAPRCCWQRVFERCRASALKRRARCAGRAQAAHRAAGGARAGGGGDGQGPGRPPAARAHAARAVRCARL